MATSTVLNMKQLQRLIVLTALLVTFTAWPHHSTAGYDEKQNLTLKGTAKKFYWTNPHMFVYLEVLDDKGATMEWVMEVGTPSVNARNGWKPTDIKAGDNITVDFHPSRDGRPDGFAKIVYLANGEKRYCPGFDAGRPGSPLSGESPPAP